MATGEEGAGARTAVIITHAKDLLAHLRARVLMLYDGRVLYDGPYRFDTPLDGGPVFVGGSEAVLDADWRFTEQPCRPASDFRPVVALHHPRTVKPFRSHVGLV